MKMTKSDKLHQLLTSDHVFNLSAIERKVGLRKLKLHEWVKGTTYLDEKDVLKISKLLDNATKLQK
jgi:hypothetical protein